MPANDSRPNARRTRLARTLVVLAALGAAAFLARNLVLGKPVQTVVATRGALTQTVVASGRIVTPQRVSISATITERVARIPVEEGQSVKRGEVLIELDDSDERAALAQAQAAVAQAQAKLRQLREVALPAAEQALAQARANALQARQNYERTTALREKGFVGEAQLDDARRARDVAESQLRAAELQVASNRPTGSDYAMAQTALEQARASLASAQAKLAQTRDPRPGRRRADQPQRGAGQRGAAGQGADGARALRRDADRGADRREEPRAAGPRAEGARFGRRVSRQALRGRGDLHQPRCRPAARLGRGQAQGAAAARLPAPGHDRLGRHRGRASQATR